jgi:hypothetical protein
MFSKEKLNDKQRFVWDKENLMLYEIIPAYVDMDNDINNELEFEKHNALWRTGLACIIYDDLELIEGVKRCFRRYDFEGKYHKEGETPKKYKYQASRCNPRMWEEDVSRDQVIMGIAALELKNKEYSKEIAGNLPFRLSRRFIMTASLFFWLKWISNKNKFNEAVASLLFFIETFFSFIISFIGIKIGLKQIVLPYFAVFLTSWQLRIMPDNFLLNLSKKMLLWIVKKMDINNFVMRKLLGDVEITLDNFKDYKPMTSHRWEVYLPSTKRYIREMTSDESAANTLDTDLVKYLFK